MSHRSRYYILPLSVAICLLGGCINRNVDGNTVHFSFATWVPLVSGVAGIAAFFVAYALRRTGWYYPLIAGVAGVAGLFFAVQSSLDYVVVDDKHFAMSTGFFFAPTRHDVSFDDTRLMELSSEEKRGRRGRRTTSYYLTCFSKSKPTSEKVPVGDMMKEALGDILVRAEGAGVAFTDQTQAER